MKQNIPVGPHAKPSHCDAFLTSLEGYKAARRNRVAVERNMGASAQDLTAARARENSARVATAHAVKS